MPFEYLEDDTSDAGFLAWGEDAEALFVAAWEAALGLMIENPEHIAATETQDITCRAPDLETLLFDVLGELLYLKDARATLFRVAHIEINSNEGGYELHAALLGDAVDAHRNELGVDLKAVTFDRFAVWRDDSLLKARVVLDA